MKIKTHKYFCLRTYALVFSLAVPLFVSSCVSSQNKFGSPGHITTKSNRYVLCRLVRDETPESLARVYLGSAAKTWMIEDANAGAAFRRGEVIIIPLKIENRAGLFADGYQTVPILCYHRFAASCNSQLCIPEKTFIEQMKYLKDNNYRVISVGMLMDFLQYRQAVPKKSVVLTIDDGYRSVYNVAFPILQQFGFKATLFIYTDFVAGGNALTWEQIQEMKAAGFEIGSHTSSHTDLSTIRSNESRQDYLKRIRSEIFDSKAILDQKLRQDTILFAYPFGRTNPTVIDMVQKAGYKMGFSVTRGGNPFPSPLFNLKRDQILTRNPFQFTKRLKTFHKVSLEENIK